MLFSLLQFPSYCAGLKMNVLGADAVLLASIFEHHSKMSGGFLGLVRSAGSLLKSTRTRPRNHKYF